MTDKEIRAACVIGWPVAHSRSPLLHGYWIARYGIAGSYGLEAVRPEDFPEFVANLAEHGYLGANVTLPHKEMALKLSDHDARARAVGAANTLWLEDGRLRSTNTDVEGFLGSLDAAAPGWNRELDNAVVFGAGGAARAVVYGLIERGAGRIHVVNRTLSRAEAFRQRFGPRVHPAGWEEAPGLIAEARLIANATSLGMTGNADIDWDLGPAPDDAVVADIVYVPLKTSLLAAAERRGLRTADGLDMLLYQGVRGFELWFGIRPEVTAELRALMESGLVED